MFNLYLFQAAPGPSLGSFFVMMALLIGVMYFVLFRPQASRQKRWQAMVNELKAGECFGEMALLNVGQSTRNATVRAIEPLDVLSVPKHDINALVEHIPPMEQYFSDVMEKRRAMNQKTNPEPTLIIKRKDVPVAPEAAMPPKIGSRE